MWTLFAFDERWYTMIDLIEGAFPFRIESQRDHGAIVIGPFPSFGRQQADVYMGQYLGFGHIVELSKGSQ